MAPGPACPASVYLAPVRTAPSPWALALVAFATGCAAGPAGTVDARAVPPPHALGTDAETIPLDGTSLVIEVTVSAFVTRTLRLPKVHGALVFSPRDPQATTLAIHADLTAAEATPGFVADIAKSHFLHTDRFPEARFSSLSVRATDGTFDVFGDLELHGVTRTLRVPAVLEVRGCRLHYASDFTVDRRPFGVVASGSLDELVDDDVEVHVSIDVDRPRCSAAAR